MVHCQGMERESGRPLDSDAKTFGYAFGFFRAAQRAFINADNFFLAAALIEGRLLAFLGADFPFHFAHRCFIASEIRLRAAAPIVRRFWRVAGAVCDFRGRPRRGPGEPARPSSAEMAWSMRARSDLSSVNMLSRSTRILSGETTVGQCSSRGGTA
jgi:hypothetical protein